MFTVNDLKRIWYSLNDGEINGPESPTLVEEFLAQLNAGGAVGPQGEQGPPGTPAYPEGTLIYRANLSQESTDPPTAVVFQDTLGLGSSWQYAAPGHYGITGEFPAGLTFIRIGSVIRTQPQAYALAARLDDANVEVKTYDPDQVGTVDNLLFNTSIEIIVFPLS